MCGCKGGSKILKPCGVMSRQLFLSCNPIRGRSEILNTFKNFEQIAFFVPCRDGGSEILNPCGIMNRLPFCSVKLWAGGSEIPNLSNKESAIGARSLLHEIVQFDGIGKLDAMFLVDSSEHFFFSFSLAKTFGRHKLSQHQIPILSKFSQIRKPHFSLEGVITLRVI